MFLLIAPVGRFDKSDPSAKLRKIFPGLAGCILPKQNLPFSSARRRASKSVVNEIIKPTSRENLEVIHRFNEVEVHKEGQELNIKIKGENYFADGDSNRLISELEKIAEETNSSTRVIEIDFSNVKNMAKQVKDGIVDLYNALPQNGHIVIDGIDEKLVRSLGLNRLNQKHFIEIHAKNR